MSLMPRARGILILALLAVFCLGLTADAWARAGGGRSMGSSGSRSYSGSGSGSGGYSSQQRPQTPASGQYQQQPGMSGLGGLGGMGGGGFMRGLAGGMLGGFVGSMLFRGVAGAGSGSGDPAGESSGPGLLDMILIGLLLYLAYRFFMRRRQAQAARQQGQAQYQADSGPFAAQPGPGYPPPPPPPGAWANSDPGADLDQGLSHIHGMDPGFDPRAFTEQAGDLFFQIQGAWTRRDLAGAAHLFTPEMLRLMQAEADKLKAAGQVNRLENIAVRSLEIRQAWQEAGQDYVTVHLLASLLDYTVEEASGKVVAGSDRDPVKFEELWTFTRPVGPGPWRLSAINQIN